YSITDQVDWDTALRENNGRVNPLGLFDLDRKIRKVGEAYKQLIADWRQVLPTQSVCLQVPVDTSLIEAAHPEDFRGPQKRGAHLRTRVDAHLSESVHPEVFRRPQKREGQPLKLRHGGPRQSTRFLSALLPASRTSDPRESRASGGALGGRPGAPPVRGRRGG